MRPRMRQGLSVDLTASWLDVRRNAVVDAAREFYRTGGQNYDELMTTVRDLERAIDLDDWTPPSCYCGTGLEHKRGLGYHCRQAEAEHQARLAEETS